MTHPSHRFLTHPLLLLYSFVYKPNQIHHHTTTTTPHHPPPRYEMQMFQRYNISGSGSISPDEFHEALRRETDPKLVEGFMAYASGSMQNF